MYPQRHQRLSIYFILIFRTETSKFLFLGTWCGLFRIGAFYATATLGKDIHLVERLPTNNACINLADEWTREQEQGVAGARYRGGSRLSKF